MFRNYGWKLVVSVSPTRPLYLVGYLHQTQIALVKFLLGLVCLSNDFWFYPLCRLACAFIKFFSNKQIEVKGQTMGVSVPLPLLVHHSPTYPFKITLGSLKVGLVLGECIVMCCRYLRYPILIIPHLYCSLYILLTIFSGSWADFMFCLKLKLSKLTRPLSLIPCLFRPKS